MGQFPYRFQVVPATGAEDPLQRFFQATGRYANFEKETLFLRFLAKDHFEHWVALCRSWERPQFGYLYVENFPNRLDVAQAAHYRTLYSQNQLHISFHFQNPLWNEAFLGGMEEILHLFQTVRNCKEESIRTNFAVKLLYWVDTLFPKLFVETRKMTQFPKLVCSGTIGLSEYLFLYLLYRLGCDVLYLGRDSDVSVTSPQLLSFSLSITDNTKLTSMESAVSQHSAGPTSPTPPTISRSQLRRPDREPAKPISTPQPRSGTHPSDVCNQQQPMDYEQLSQFASSVVMLQVFDEHQTCLKTGSGIIIGEQGYILTNYHVVCGGAYYGILLEDEPEMFYTTELIKCHAEWDLAVLRFHQKRPPIPILDTNEKLVRGQQIVAIGSPLGLFNTISNGIISGFREVHEISMVQFTAPVSPGSSGGALLDLYGRLIGVITAGFHDGQNLNLAVDYRTIHQFMGNLI